MNFSKKILFTGAGFTADFGGYLATEMWSKIFNNENLKNFPKIKEELRDKFDFEFAYWSIMGNSSYSVAEKKALLKAIVQAYNSMNTNIFNTSRNVHLANLFNTFRGDSYTVSAHFTLNQDLFLEQRFGRISLGLRTPEYKDYSEAINARSLIINDITLPTDELLKKIRDQYLSSAGSEAYIKLHGSSGWLSSDGSNAIVIGFEKSKNIAAEPLLKWYFELFNQAINVGDAKILIIGYGFRDQHINIALAKAVKKSNLKIYVLSPGSPLTLKSTVNGFFKNDYKNDKEEATNCSQIWEGVEGYFPYKTKELFPNDGSTPNTQVDLLKIFA